MRKRKLKIYYFLLERKLNERIHLFITESMNIYQTKKKEKIPIVMKTCFSEGKLMKQFGKPTF